MVVVVLNNPYELPVKNCIVIGMVNTTMQNNIYVINSTPFAYHDINTRQKFNIKAIIKLLIFVSDNCIVFNSKIIEVIIKIIMP